MKTKLLTKEQEQEIENYYDSQYSLLRNDIDNNKYNGYISCCSSRYDFCHMNWIPKNADNFEFLHDRWPEILKICKKLAKKYNLIIVKKKRGNQYIYTMKDINW